MAFKMSSPFNFFGAGSNPMEEKRKAEADAKEKFEYDRAYNAKMQEMQAREGGGGVPNDAQATERAVAEGVNTSESPLSFKLKSKMPDFASGGRINKKHQFSIEREKLEEGVLGEAYPDKVVIDKDIKEGSALEKKVVSHEAQHVKDMANGDAAFGDDWVEWKGERYPRKDGKVKYKGKWKLEGDDSFPWEQSAIKAEK